MSTIKEEPPWESDLEDQDASDTAEKLCLEHSIKDELVLEPEVFQPPDSHYKRRTQIQMKSETERSKREPEFIVIQEGKQFTIRSCFINLQRVDKERIASFNQEPKFTIRPCSINVRRVDEFCGNMYINEPQNTCNYLDSQATDSTGGKYPPLSGCFQQNLSTNKYIDEVHPSSLSAHEKLTKKEIGNFKQEKDTVLEIFEGKQFTIRACSIILQRIDELCRNWNFKGSRYICKICQKAYKTRYTLTRHMQDHIKKNPDVKKLILCDTQIDIFMCDICRKVYYRKKFLIRHIQLHMENKVCHRTKHARVYRLKLSDPLVISADPKKIASMGIENTSSNSTHKQLPISNTNLNIQPSRDLNPECNKYNQLEREYKTKCEIDFIQKINSDQMTQKEVYVCDMCGEWFPQKSVIIEHFQDRKKHRVRAKLNKTKKGHTITCDICKEQFPTKYTLTNHLLHAHLAVRAYTCQTCPKQFSYKEARALHERVHNKPILKPFGCGLCNKQFLRRDYLYLHHTYVHKNQRLYTCNVCLKKCKRKQDLALHLRTHTGEKPYGCSKCSKRFSQKSTLNKHFSRRHVDQKPYHCKTCPKHFATQASLILHERGHSVDKPFGCGMCPKRFHDQSKLNRHKLIHTGLKPHECKICSKRFLAKENMKRHEAIHTSEKSYQCEICKKQFSEKYTLKNHQVVHSGSKNFACKICKKRFGFATSLHVHSKIHRQL